jgi:hypothetical protein
MSAHGGGRGGGRMSAHGGGRGGDRMSARDRRRQPGRAREAAHKKADADGSS